jgi:hypothetical protein
VIRYDFYRLFQEFWEGKVNLQSINDSFITLIPKIASPETANDFRPISLLNICLKLITKLLANRLQNRILELVHVNQYGFLKSRNIQDCVGWAYEYLHQCKQSGNEVVILKLDFAKAFDTVEHQAIMRVLACQGYDEKWLHWMSMIMGTGTSSVLLNGVPGKKFFCKRGVRQGDPLSPILFVSVAELLQCMVNQLFHEGIFLAPLPIPNTDFPIIQYADDTLVIMQACPIQLLALKELLEKFAQATGLRVNYAKSAMMPINISEERLTELATVFGCATGVLPFTYLGLPLGTTKPTIQDMSPLVSLVERRMNASARFLNYGGRLQFVQSVLSSLPNFYMCSLKVQKAILNICDRASRHCLWAKEEGNSKTHSLAAWSMVCKPKEKGGLGILNLELQNRALLLKQLHKFYMKAETPWVQLVWSLYGDSVPHAKSKRGSFWWRDIFSLVDEYRSITRCSFGDGSTVLFWKDFWDDGELLCEKFPRLYSFVIDEDISVAAIHASTDLFSHFVLPLSVEAFQELQLVSEKILAKPIIPNSIDQRSFVWGSVSYAPAKYYRFLFALLPSDATIKAIWKSKMFPKLKVFIWLMFHDRLNTRDMISRRHWHLDSGYVCALCESQSIETRDHLFFECSFAQECWSIIGIHWEMTQPISARILAALQHFDGPCFMEIIACAAWNIWKIRNEWIMQGVTASLDRWKIKFQNDVMLHQYKVKAALVQPLIDWLLRTFV